MKAIVTKYLSPTNYRGARIKATDGDNSVTISYDYSLPCDECHAKAALALCRKLCWTGNLIEGNMKTGNVYIFDNGDQYRIA